MPLDLKALLRRLSEATGVSGYEEGVRAIVQETVTPLTNEQRVDVMGNYIALKRGECQPGTDQAPGRVVLAAHMDEIGLVVAGVEGEYLRFVQVGGYDPRLLPGQEVLVHTTGGLSPAAYPGVIGMRPRSWSYLAEPEHVAEYTDLVIDLGMPAASVAAQVQIGDLVTMRAPMIDLGSKLIAGKAFDDRACLAAVLGAMDQLARLRHRWDVYCIATTQEEVGLRGAKTAAFGVEADLAVVLDVTFANQPGATEQETFEIGRGPVIAYGPNFHPALSKRLAEIARRLEIPYQEEAVPGHSGTDAWAFQVARSGMPTVLVEITTASMHAPNELVDPADLDRTARLLAEFVNSLDENSLNEFRYHLPE